MEEKKRKYFRELIKKGNIRIALDELSKIEMHDSQVEELAYISSKYYINKQNARSGLITHEEATVTENRLIEQLITLTNYLTGQNSKKPNSGIRRRSTKLKNVGFVLILIGLGVGLVLGIRIIQKPPQLNTIHQLTLYLLDTEGNVTTIKKGKITITLGKQVITEHMGKNGHKVYFDGLSIKKGDTVKISLETTDWEIINDKRDYIFDGNPIRLVVKRGEKLGRVKGIIQSKISLKLLEDAKIQINEDTVISSNKMGSFNILLPEKMRVKSSFEHYLLIIKKDSFKTATEIYYPDSRAEIRLERN